MSRPVSAISGANNTIHSLNKLVKSRVVFSDYQSNDDLVPKYFCNLEVTTLEHGPPGCRLWNSEAVDVERSATSRG